MNTEVSNGDGDARRSTSDRSRLMAGARLLVVVTNRKERKLLADWLGKSCLVEAPDPQTYPVAKAIFDQLFDLVILDGPALADHRNLIRLLREKEEDLFMPLLLVTSRESVNHATEDLWRLIDEVIVKPIEKAELNARIATLLRARHYSLKLQERYYSLAEIAPVGIVVMDRHGIIRYANKHAHQIFVERGSHYVGRSVDEPWEFIDPAGHRVPRDERPFARVISTGKPVHDREITFRKPSGAELRLSISGVPITAADGRIASVLLVAKDITAQIKQAEELRRALARAEEMSRLKTSFLANMSHEIRTPLTGILSSAEILSGETAGELQEIADLITISADRLRRTLSTVLDLAQLESNTWRFSDTSTELTEVVSKVVAEQRRPAEERNVEIAVDSPSSCNVRYDRGALERIIDSLVSNAVKFTRNGRVHVRVDCSADPLLVEVRDEGIGISRDFLPYIFEEFKQESVGATRDFEGSGLGLTIANRLVTLLGGHIEVESTKGEGSTFKVVLPAGEPEGDLSKASPSEEGQASSDVLQMLPDSPDAYFRIFERHPFPCIILDANARTIRQANAAIRFYGYSSNDLVGTRFSDFCAADDSLARAAENETGWGRWNIRGRDGTFRTVLAIFYAIRAGGGRHTVVHLLDDEPVPDTNFVRADRLRQLQILQSFSSRIAAAKGLPALYRTVAESMHEAFEDVEALGLWAYDGDDDRLTLAAASGPRDQDELMAFSEFPELRSLLALEEIRVEYSAEGGISAPFAGSRTFAHAQSVVVVPLRAGGRPMAVLVLASARAKDPARFIDQQMMQAFATLGGMVIQRLGLIKRLRRASRLLVEAQESERRAISQDIHDEIGGLLSSLQLVLKMVASDDPSVVNDLQEAVDIVDQLVAHTRDVSFRLSPRMLTDLGLIPTLRSYTSRFAARTRIDVTLQNEVDPDSRFENDVESTAFRVVQESLTNAGKYADAEAVQIHLRVDEDSLFIHVIDDGKGFDPDKPAGRTAGTGLRGLSERLNLIGGRLEITSLPGEGTRISAVLPLAAAHEEDNYDSDRYS